MTSPADLSVLSPGPENRVVFLTGGGAYAWCAANALVKQLGRPITMLIEQGVPAKQLVRSRARLRGWPYAIGQFATDIPFRVISRLSQRRISEIQQSHGLDPTPGPGVTVHHVSSANGSDCLGALQAMSPAVVAVFGTRILKQQTLTCVDAPFINYHAGINPKYRGQDPGYWALVNGDAENAGVTVHLIDKGVDTGPVLYQSRVEFTPRDNITTYQMQQLAVALPLFGQAIADGLENRLQPKTVDLPSMQWFPPTLWTYLRNGLARGVW